MVSCSLHLQSLPGRADFRAHEHIDFGDFHCETQSLFARSCCLCHRGGHLFDDDCDALYSYLVCFTLKALQAVPTSVPTNVLSSSNSIASREVISPAVAVSVAFAEMVAMPAFGLSWLHSESFLGCVWSHRSLVLLGGHGADLVGETKQCLAVCIFLQYIISPLFLATWLSVYVVVATSA